MDSILMSSSEKQWVTKIQMLQIQTAKPYEEDYYYEEDESMTEDEEAGLINPYTHYDYEGTPDPNMTQKTV